MPRKPGRPPAQPAAHATTKMPVRMKIRPSELTFDERVQRALRADYVARIAKDFNIALIGVVTVSIRRTAQGEKWVVLDGQHRCQAQISVGKGDVEIETNVYENLTVQEEAQLFADLNKHKLKMDALSYFHVALTAEETHAVRIANILDRFGLRIPKRPVAIDGCVACVKTIEKIWSYDGGKQLHEVLEILHGAWGVSKKAYDGAMISGVATFLRKYPDYGHGLTEKLKDTIPDKVMAGAKHTKSMSGVSLDEAYLRHFVDVYNKNRKTKKIVV